MVNYPVSFFWKELPAFLLILASATTFVSAITGGAAASAVVGNSGSSSNSSIWWTTSYYYYFRRGSANVQWCEDVIASHKHDEWIAEYYNTWSNMIFLIVALVGYHRCYRKTNNPVVGGEESNSNNNRRLLLHWSFWMSESIMTMIGIGSWLFHAHQSKVAQWSDEFPMVLLLLAQSHCLENLHPTTTTTTTITTKKGGQQRFVVQKLPSYYLYNHTFVLLYWSLYSYLDRYDIFLNGFGIQMAALFALGYDTGRRRNQQQQQRQQHKHSHFKWYCSFTALAIAKGLWELERFRYNSDQCDAPGTLWLHPLWHVGAGLSHMIMMSNYADLQQEQQQQQQQPSSAAAAAAAATTTRIGDDNQKRKVE